MPSQLSPRKFSRRDMLKTSAAGFAAFLAACQSAPTLPTATPKPSLEALSVPLEALIAAAKQEGALSVMTLPHDWANYGELIDTYRTKYSVVMNELLPDGSSSDEVEAIRASKTQITAASPDVVDMGLSFAETSKAEGLFAPYQVATWNTIPADLKDSGGHWYSSYYGVLSFAINRDVVKEPPRDWDDLLKPQYKDMVALRSNPARSSQSINAVWAAGLFRAASLGDAPDAGLEYFAELNRVGNFVPLFGLPEMIASGRTPIVVMWDFLALADRDTLKDKANIEVVLPAASKLAVPSIQAISAYAPHPFAARLWEEFLYSDEGQLLWLKGYAHPVRYADLVKSNKIPADLAAKLLPAELYAKAVFPSSAQTENARKVITENWMSKVGVEVKRP